MFTWIPIKMDISTSFCVYFSVHAMRKSTRFVRRAFCLCMLQCLCSENRTGLSSLLRQQIYPYRYVCSSLTPTYWHFFKFNALCSKCILAYVPHLTSHAADSFWMNLIPNRPSLFRLDLRHHFCQKKVFVCYRLVVVSERNVVEELNQHCFYYSSSTS